MRSANTFKDWRQEGAAMMLEPFERIQSRKFPPINFMSKLECNRLGKLPASDLNCSSVEVIDVDDRDNIPYSQKYLVATSNKMRAHRCPLKATQSPKTMSIWKFSRYWRCFLIVLP